MVSVKKLDVCIAGVKVGTLAVTDNYLCAFEYSDEWLMNGYSISPFSLPLEKKVYMLIGPIRHQFTSKQRIEQQNIDHYVYPRFTRVINLGDSKQDINSAYLLIAKSTIRNEMIISDVKECIKNKRTPIVLTRYKEHAKYLYDVLKKDVLEIGRAHV